MEFVKQLLYFIVGVSMAAGIPLGLLILVVKLLNKHQKDDHTENS